MHSHSSSLLLHWQRLAQITASIAQQSSTVPNATLVTFDTTIAAETIIVLPVRHLLHHLLRRVQLSNFVSVEYARHALISLQIVASVSLLHSATRALTTIPISTLPFQAFSIARCVITRFLSACSAT
jgi:hypothetical protein